MLIKTLWGRPSSSHVTNKTSVVQQNFITHLSTVCSRKLQSGGLNPGSLFTFKNYVIYSSLTWLYIPPWVLLSLLQVLLPSRVADGVARSRSVILAFAPFCWHCCWEVYGPPLFCFQPPAALKKDAALSTLKGGKQICSLWVLAKINTLMYKPFLLPSFPRIRFLNFGLMDSRKYTFWILMNADRFFPKKTMPNTTTMDNILSARAPG